MGMRLLALTSTLVLLTACDSPDELSYDPEPESSPVAIEKVAPKVAEPIIDRTPTPDPIDDDESEETTEDTSDTGDTSDTSSDDSEECPEVEEAEECPEVETETDAQVWAHLGCEDARSVHWDYIDLQEKLGEYDRDTDWFSSQVWYRQRNVFAATLFDAMPPACMAVASLAWVGNNCFSLAATGERLRLADTLAEEDRDTLDTRYEFWRSQYVLSATTDEDGNTVYPDCR